jgi:hypothetical protein
VDPVLVAAEVVPVHAAVEVVPVLVAAAVVPVLVAVEVVPVLAEAGSLVPAAVGKHQEVAAGPFDLDYKGVAVDPVLLVPTGSEVEAGPARVLAADHEGRTGRYEAAVGCTQVDSDLGAANLVLVAVGILVVAVGILVADAPAAADSLAVAVGILVAEDSPEVHDFQEEVESCSAPKVNTKMVARWSQVRRRPQACSLLVPTKL